MQLFLRDDKALLWALMKHLVVEGRGVESHLGESSIGHGLGSTVIWSSSGHCVDSVGLCHSRACGDALAVARLYRLCHLWADLSGSDPMGAEGPEAGR